MMQADRSHRKHGDSLVINKKWIFIAAVNRATIFYYPQTTCGDLVVSAVIEKDDAVRNVLFQAVASQRPVATLAGDDSGNPSVFEPAKKSAQFVAQNKSIAERGKYRLKRVEDHAFGADRVDRVPQPNKQSLQVILSGFFDFTSFQVNVVDD